MKNNKRVIIYALFISILLHLVFVSFSLGMRLPGVQMEVERTQNFFNIKTVKREDVKKGIPAKESEEITTIQFSTPVYSQLIQSQIMEEEKNVRKKDLLKREELIEEPQKFQLEQKVDELAKIDIDKELFKQKLTRQTREQLVSVGNIEEKDGIDWTKLIDYSDISDDFIEKMPGITPDLTTGAEAHGEFSAYYPQSQGIITRKEDYDNIEGDLTFDLMTYQDPEDNQKYFRLRIHSREKTENLKTLPKEITFLVDCSYSINQDRLNEIKDGLHYALTHLNPEDRFNVIAFKENIIKAFPDSSRGSEEKIQKAINFVSHLTPGSKTDTYNALFMATETPPLMRPSYIVFISDGLPTKGITNSVQIINKISALNQERTSIFAFSGGLGVNRYLLDFISYKNRGWSEYAGRTHQMGEYLSAMYQKIKDPLLLDLRYQISGMDSDQIYPKMLPDFFRDAEFTLYGIYDSEDQISLRLLGNTQGRTKEYILTGVLSKAASGDSEIARGWALNKIYYLISQIQPNQENEQIRVQIKFLMKKFNIRTPYARILE